MTTLVDTSVWIEVFRSRAPLDLERTVDFAEIATCLPVIQEVLQGFRKQGAYRKAELAMTSLPVLESPLSWGVYREAVEIHRTGRGQGLTIRSSVDCLIAACALRHDVEVLHRDRDFRVIARYTRLRERSP